MDPGLEGGSGSEKFSDEICGWFRDPPVVGRSLVRKKETGRSCKESCAVPAMLGTIIVYAGDVETVLLLANADVR